MDSTVKTRINHYETLGIAPTAASDEIARAFAEQTSVFRPHAFGGMTELFIAYETLRNPIKRRAYDASIGLGPKPDVPTSSAFVAAYPRPKVAVVHAQLPPEPDMDPKPMPKEVVEQARMPATSPSSVLPLNRISDDSAPRPAPIPEPRILQSPGQPTSFALDERFGIEAAPIEWKRAALVVGGVVLATCLLGGAAGWWSSSDIGEQAPQQKAVSVPLPRATQAAAVAEPPSPASTGTDRRPDLPGIAKPAERGVPHPKIAENEPQPVEELSAGRASETDALDPTTPELATAQEPAAVPVASSMPLPNQVIARTIHRIGYSCGDVIATNPVDGAAGTYKVNCSSGQSYQATPVNGRYRFRRLR